MRAKYLCAWTRHICVLALALSSFACRAPHHEPEPETATRAEVSDALHLQLTLVLERHDKLVLSKSAAAQNEQKVLAELATEIEIRIFRIDPHVRLDHSANLRSGG